MPEFENYSVPMETHESWRTWLMTGTRRTPVDKRRLRGAHKGLKKILLEGLTGNGDHTHRWQDFSGAMVRHAVDDAMRQLPPEETQVVKLAYFGGYSNREIAREVGLTEGTVQRRLRNALAAISDHIQHGQALGRRAAYGIALFLSGRWLSENTSHVWTATAVAGAAVVIVAAQPLAGPVHHSFGPAAPSTQSMSRSAPVVAPVPSPTAPVQVTVPSGSQSVAGPATLPAVTLPTINVPAVKLPVPTPTPVKIKNPL